MGFKTRFTQVELALLFGSDRSFALTTKERLRYRSFNVKALHFWEFTAPQSRFFALIHSDYFPSLR